jgi:formate-nitrite transporter family protein
MSTRAWESPPSDAPDLDEREHAQAEEAARLSAEVTYEVIRHQGEEELKRSTSGLLWSGLAAGLSMGFSLVAQGVLRSHLPDAPWRPLVAGLGYPMGFLIVILASQQLFTENTLTVIVPLLARRDGRTFADVARLWSAVLVANLVGALAFAAVLARTELFPPDVRAAFAEIARPMLAASFAVGTLKGIFAGWLIAIMVWMLPAARGLDVVVILLITWLVGVAALLHVIAGTVDVSYLAWSGQATWGDVLTRFLAPALLGNVIGGVIMASAISHAQVVSGGGKKSGSNAR